MNFLAHSSLAFDDPAVVAGQFAGDFVRGRNLSRFPARVASGIRLHRRVDAFTDAHPAVAEARRGFGPDLRRHAGIVIDVIFDHLLAREWPAPDGRELHVHVAWAEAALVANEPCLPPALVRFRAYMAREGVLVGNRDPRNVAATFTRLSRRSSTLAPLALAATRVEPLADRLQASFRTLWPALEEAARARLDELLADERQADEVAAGAPAAGAPAAGAPVADERRTRTGGNERT